MFVITQAAKDAPLVDKLRWLLEARFARASAIGARTLTADWSVSLGGLIGAASSCRTMSRQKHHPMPDPGRVNLPSWSLNIVEVVTG